MLGAIIGDVVGSYYEVLEVKEIKNGHRSYEERIKILDQNTPLFPNLDLPYISLPKSISSFA